MHSVMEEGFWSDEVGKTLLNVHLRKWMIIQLTEVRGWIYNSWSLALIGKKDPSLFLTYTYIESPYPHSSIYWRLLAEWW